MSPYEPVAIVTQSAITRGKRLRHLWLTGWALAVMSLIGSAFLSGQVVAYKDTARELEHARAELKTLQAEQYKLTLNFASAWQDQRNTVDLVTSWATYIKERDDIGNFNRKNAPIDLTRSMAKSR